MPPTLARTMKLQPDRSNTQTVTGYGPGWLAVDGERLHSSVIVGSGGQREVWARQDFSELDASDFERLAAMSTELVIFGSGTRLRFPPAPWLRPLIERRIGLETMDTAAACRTYNILAGEGRSVLLAALIEPQT